jgi:Na+-translocating ferredoxin:NAD+ oxidoreductase subunit E
MKPTTASEDFLRGIWRENPVLVTVLGLCPTLAVTNTVINGFAMGIATTLVILGSSVIVSLTRTLIPKEVRISAWILIIATFVTVIDLVLAAAVPDVHKALGAFIALIVANCIPLARQEVFSCKNNPWRSALDALGTGLGFTLVQVLMSAPREILGRGTFLGYPLFGPRFEPWVVMVLPPGGFLTLGCYLLALSWWKGRKTRRTVRAWPHPAVIREPAPEAGVRAVA